MLTSATNAQATEMTGTLTRKPGSRSRRVMNARTMEMGRRTSDENKRPNKQDEQ